MFDQMKYLVVAKSGFELPIVFSPVIQHKEIAKSFEEVVSGGFVYVSSNMQGELSVCCSGESLSCGVRSRPEKDAKLIARNLLIQN